MNPSSPRAEPPAPDADDWRALLSAAADGESPAVDGACRLWRDDADARATWHAYHLIGDVMRSDDLAAAPARDAAFLAALRGRLAAEPALLAPAPVRRRQVWLLPAAAAAGFAVVAGVMVVAGPPWTDDGAARLATARPPADVRVVAVEPVPAASTSMGRIIRSPEIDRLLRAHRSVAALGAVAVPGGAPRNVEFLVLDEPVAKPVAR